jgi:hypothetical protein
MPSNTTTRQIPMLALIQRVSEASVSVDGEAV